jgi:kynurenine formamidase
MNGRTISHDDSLEPLFRFPEDQKNPLRPLPRSAEAENPGGLVFRQLAPLAALAALLLSCSPAPAPEPEAPRGPAVPGTIVDLTHAFDEDTIYWPTAEPFHLERVSHAVTEKGFFYAANNFSAAEHGGTHLDAPIHFFEGGHASDEIPIEQLIGLGVVVDVRQKCADDRDYRVQVEDFEAWESENGPLPDGAIVLLRTGWESRWDDREAYLGTGMTGPEAVPELHFPGLHPEAARWLATERSIKAVGLDTPSIDHGPSELFESHVTLFEADIPAFENVAHLDSLPPQGFVVAALPMKIRGGSGGPLRIVAWW